MNLKKLSDMNQPAKTVLRQHKGRNAAKATEEDADDLSQTLALSSGPGNADY